MTVVRRVRAGAVQTGSIDPLVAAIAEGLVPRMLATAEVGGTVAVRHVPDGSEFGSAVGAIAEWLVAAAPASAPEIRSAFGDFHCVGTLLRNDCFR